MPSVTGSWRRRESNGIFASPASRLTFSSCPLGRDFACLDSSNRTSPRGCGVSSSGLPTIRSESGNQIRG